MTAEILPEPVQPTETETEPGPNQEMKKSEKINNLSIMKTCYPEIYSITITLLGNTLLSQLMKILFQ